MKITKMRTVFERGALIFIAISYMLFSLISLIAPTSAEAAKPKYTLTDSFGGRTDYGVFSHIKVAHDGTTYAISENGRNIQQYSPTGSFVRSWDSGIRSITGADVDPQGNLNVSGSPDEAGTGVVARKYANNGQLVTQFISPNTNAHSYDISSGSSGNMYIFTGQTVEVYDSEGTYVREFNHNQLDSYSGLIVVSAEYVYVYSGHTISKYQLDGTEVTNFDRNPGTSRTSGMVLNSNGNLLLSNITSNAIEEMTPNGSIVRTINVEEWPSAKLVHNWSADTDDEGSIYIGDIAMNVITKFSVSGEMMYEINRENAGKFGESFAGKIGVDDAGNIYAADSRFIQKFDKNGNFIKRFGGGEGDMSYFPPTDGRFSNLNNIAVSETGDVYVYDYSRHQFQKFDTNGNFIARFGSQGSGDGQILNELSGMTVGVNGSLYVADTTNHRVQVFNSAGQYISQWTGDGSEEDQSTYINAITSDSGGNIYTSESTNSFADLPTAIKKFNSNGIFIKKWSKTDYSHNKDLGTVVRDIAVDGDGNIFTNSSGAASIERYDSNGVHETTIDPFSGGQSEDFSNRFVIGEGNSIIGINSDSGLISVISPDGFTYEPSVVRNLNIADIKRREAVISFESPLEDGGDAVTGYGIEIKKASSGNWDGVMSDDVGTDTLSLRKTGLEPNTSYDVRVRAMNNTGPSPYVALSFTTAATPPKEVTNVSFTVEQGKKTMTITGSSLVGADDEYEYYDALTRSLVTVNGVEMPFCTEGSGLDKAAFLVYFGMDPSIVSDASPCYEFYDSDGELALTETSATVHLADNFDITAQGTVSVNGSNTFTFNQQTTPGNEITEPTVIVGNKSLETKPTINKRPTFSGTAEPGAIVTVTVRSDPITCTTTADSNGNWSCTLPSDLPPGDHTVTVRVVNPDSSVEELGPYAVIVAEQGNGSTIVTPATPLAPNTGDGRMLGVQNNYIIYSVISMSIVLAFITVIGYIRQLRSAKQPRRTRLKL